MAYTITTRNQIGTSASSATIAGTLFSGSVGDHYVVWHICEANQQVISVSDTKGNFGVPLGRYAASTSDEFLSAWLVRCATAVTGADTCTVTLDAAVTDQCMGIISIIGVASGNTFRQSPEAAFVTAETTGNGFGSQAYSGLTSKER